MSQSGWICPVCGRGNAPTSPHCDCYREDKPKPPETDEERMWKRLAEQNKNSDLQKTQGLQHDFDQQMIGGKCRRCGWCSALPYRECR